MSNPTDLFAPFENDDGYFILCVRDGKITKETEGDGDYTEYHIEKVSIYDDVWRIERADAPELCETVFEGRIPNRAFFEALMNNQSTPLPSGWDQPTPQPIHGSL